MNAITQIHPEHSVTIAGAVIPVAVEQEPDGWWIARGRLSPHHNEFAAACRFDAQTAVDRLRRKLTTWSN